MKKIVFLAILLFAFATTNGQTSGQVATYTTGVGAATDGLYNYAMGSISDKNNKASFEDRSIEGSPYKSNEFHHTSIYYGDEVTGKLYYRYNAYNEEIEIKQQNLDEETPRALAKDKKIKIIVDGKPMGFKTFIDKNGKTQNGYLTLLQDGGLKLYKRLHITFKEAKKASNSFEKNIPARFNQNTEYYLETEDGKKISEVELSNKRLLKQIPSAHKQTLKSYFSESKLKTKTEQDLIMIIAHLNK